jgi:hypothetical protein
MEAPVFRKTALLPLIDRRPSLFDLWTLHKFHSGALAIKAKVPPGTVKAMLSNQPIARDDAQKVIAALSSLVQREYTLQSVSLATLEEEQY